MYMYFAIATGKRCERRDETKQLLLERYEMLCWLNMAGTQFINEQRPIKLSEEQIYIYIYYVIILIRIIITSHTFGKHKNKNKNNKPKTQLNQTKPNLT